MLSLKLINSILLSKAKLLFLCWHVFPLPSCPLPSPPLPPFTLPNLLAIFSSPICFSIYFLILFLLLFIQAKKRQVYLEETYSGCMKELELLLENFRIDNSMPLSAKSKPSTTVPKGPNLATANRRSKNSPQLFCFFTSLVVQVQSLSWFQLEWLINLALCNNS